MYNYNDPFVLDQIYIQKIDVYVHDGDSMYTLTQSSGNECTAFTLTNFLQSD